LSDNAVVDFIDGVEIWHISKVKMYMGYESDKAVWYHVQQGNIRACRERKLWFYAESIRENKKNVAERSKMKNRRKVVIKHLQVRGNSLTFEFDNYEDMLYFVGDLKSRCGTMRITEGG